MRNSGRFKETMWDAGKNITGCTPHFQVQLQYILSLRNIFIHLDIGAKDYHFLESSIANITAKLEQCKSPEEKGKAIANFKMNTKRLEEVSIVLMHIVDS